MAFPGPFVFAFVGSLLSFVGAGAVFTVLVHDRDARRQVRPRLLLSLAGMDTVAALVSIIFNVLYFVDPNTLANRLSWPTSSHVFGFIVVTFQVASWIWTAMIAEHVAMVVMIPSTIDNTVAEANREKIYWSVWCLAMVIFAPAFGYEFLHLLFVEKDAVGESMTIIVYQVICTIWIVICLLRVVLFAKPSAGL
jgi:hypothetical protein